MKLLVVDRREGKFHSMELSLLGTFAPGSMETFAPAFASWNCHSLELSLTGTFAPRKESSTDISLPRTYNPNFRNPKVKKQLRMTLLVWL